MGITSILRQRRPRVGEVRCERTPGQVVDLERAHEPLLIAGTESASADGRIDALQASGGGSAGPRRAATRSSRARSAVSRAGPGKNPRVSAR